jgi:hypothetical protein
VTCTALTLHQLAGAIFQNAMSSALSASGLPTGIARDSERFVFVLQAMPEALLASSAIRRFGMDAVLPVAAGARSRS